MELALSRHSVLLVLGGVLLALVVLSLVGAGLLLRVMRSQPVPTEGLLTLEDLGPGFTQAGEQTTNLGLQVVVVREFEADEESFDGGPFWIQSYATHLAISTNQDIELFLESTVRTMVISGLFRGEIRPRTGPSLGLPTAWRTIEDSDPEDPADWVVVGVQQGETRAILIVRGFRDELTTEDVADLARKVVARLARPSP
jgi:hypothetical protein